MFIFFVKRSVMLKFYLPTRSYFLYITGWYFGQRSVMIKFYLVSTDSNPND